jgi:hypothetical protein
MFLRKELEGAAGMAVCSKLPPSPMPPFTMKAQLALLLYKKEKIQNLKRKCELAGLPSATFSIAPSSL